jgi:hypothetical protein
MNLEVYRGDNLNLQVTFTDADGVSISLVGATVFFTVKPRHSDAIDDSDAVIRKVNTSHTDAAGGITTFSLTTAETLLIGDYKFDIQYKNASGQIATVTDGTIRFKADVTRKNTA